MPKIAFIHPDLGIGGAERLVVDAACGLQELDNSVVAYTLHCDRSHCFDEIVDGELAVVVYGDWLPTTIAKRFHIVCAGLRQIWLTLRLLTNGEHYDYFVVDQLSYCLPLLKLFGGDARVVFYGHFPDQLLAQRGGMAKRLYRMPFDWFEQWTTAWADKVVVNSKFTRSVFQKTFANCPEPLAVIYPCINDTEAIDANAEKEVADFFKGLDVFLSINRFERKKNIELAIKAFAQFKKTHPQKVRLVVAGGWDARVRENVMYLTELNHLCETLKLTLFTIRGRLLMMPPLTDVLFLPLVLLKLKNALIDYANILLYTPSHEHFGIVPVEAMAHGTPVLAVNNGGPLELIVHFNQRDNLDVATGFTVAPNVDEWAATLSTFYGYNVAVKSKLGENGRERAHAVFSRLKMAKSFMEELRTTSSKSVTAKVGSMVVLAAMSVALIGFVVHRLI